MVEIESGIIKTLHSNDILKQDFDKEINRFWNESIGFSAEELDLISGYKLSLISEPFN